MENIAMSTSEESSKAVGIVVTIRVITTTSDIDIATPEQLAPVLHAAIQRLGQLGRTGSLALAALVDSEDDDYNHGSFWIDSIAEGVSHSYFERRKGRAMWKLRYFANATRLLFKGNIRWVILICPRLSGPSTMIVWITKGTTNAEQEAQAGRDYRQVA
jgi:hypothetical protein